MSHLRAQLSRGLSLLGLVGSLTVALWMPPFGAPDEVAHWYRAVHLSSGHVLSTKQAGLLGDPLPLWATELPKAITEDAPPPRGKLTADSWARAQAVPYTNAKKFVAFNATAMYPPTYYLPQAIALRVGRWLHAQPLTMFYAARVVNACVCWLAIAVALRGAAELTLYWGALLLLPVILQQLGTFSPDAGMLASVVWLGVLLRRAAVGPAPQAGLFAALTLLIGLLAQARPPLLALGALLWMPALARHARRPLSQLRLRCAAAVAAIAVPWFVGSLAFGGQLRSDLPPVRVRAAELLHAPGDFVALLWHTTQVKTEDYLWMGIGSLGWFDAPIHRGAFDVAQLAVLGALVLAARRPFALRFADAACVWLAMVGSYVGMQLIFFLTWTPPGQATIGGFQGRYALMFLPLLPLGLPRVCLPRWPAAALEAALCVALVRVVATLPWTLLQRYYLCP